MGATSGAMSVAAMNTTGLVGANRSGVGLELRRGASAIAVGYQRSVNARASVSPSAQSPAMKAHDGHGLASVRR
ncbi:hypothetical protein LC55x_4950 [Lysobacter capsici]|uniref:hypothetical protein n=1 Tax=Lysobacter capsici TaxID=435897 RepID=UPI0007165B86|nr:hypothetical protein [Lysobacter capsici]ALN88197.1 hypothetical protein LC55x_4950 [Lysobacter capsici]